MDVDFLVQDTYALTRPQWKIATDPIEATRLFSEAVAQNYKVQEAAQEADKAPELEDEGESSSSDDGFEDDAIPDADEEKDEEHSSSDEVEEVWIFNFLYCGGKCNLIICLRLFVTQTRNTIPNPRRKNRSSLPARKSSLTRKLKLNLIESSRK